MTDALASTADAPPPQPQIEVTPTPDHRRADILAVASLVLLVTISFADVIVGVNNFYMRDLTRYYYPTKQILREIVYGGEFPYWNRYFSGGQPIAANPEHEVFYPLTWLILLPYDFGYRMHILVHLYIGLLGMYALLRSMQVRPEGAWFGAMSFGLGGLYLSYVNLLPILFCAAWLPLTCLYVRKFLLEHRARDFALASLFLGLQMLVGEPTTVMQTGFLLGMYALYRGWYAPRRVMKSITSVLWVGVISIVAFAIGAAQIVPAIDHVRDSARSRVFEFDLVSAWSMPWAKYAELIYPNILGHISIRQVMWYWAGGLYPGMGSPFLFSIYAGIATVALCIGGALARARGARFVLILSLFSSLLALGGHTPLLKFLYNHGIATSIRYPEKFALIGIFAIILFASQMLERALDGDGSVRDGALGFAIAVTTVAIAVAVIAFVSGVYQRTFLYIWGMTANAGSLYEVRLSRRDWVIAAVRGALLIALLLTIRVKKRRIWLAAGAAFVIADLTYCTYELNPRMPRRFFNPPPVAAQLPKNYADYRLFHEADWYGQEEIARQYFSTAEAVYWIVRNGLFPMTPAGSRIRTVLERDYDKTALLPTIDFTDSLWDVKRSGRAQWWVPFMSMSNAWYRASYRPFPVEKQRVKGNFKEATPIHYLPAERYPRYYFADQIVTIKDRTDFVKKLIGEKFSSRVAFVARPSFVPADGTVTLLKETANTATLDVESRGEGFLVMSITPHKYWRIFVDGARVPAIVTNIGYQGIVVTPGRHRVVMRYRNDLIEICLVVSGIAALATLLLAIFARRRDDWRGLDAYEEPVHVVSDADGQHVEPATTE